LKATYKIDPAHSHAQFVIRHMMITNVRGGFTKVEGTVGYDPENPAASSLAECWWAMISKSSWKLR
jgi:polyisoprenoid-binding protein YceI